MPEINQSNSETNISESQSKVGEKYEFNAEISKLMKIIIHNFYSSKDIFLRELISNASDAIDKARFNSLESNDLFSAKIKIYGNIDDKTLVIEDNGIGMTKTDVINCLGTIAKSGTEEFVSNMLNNNNKRVDLIGQFGIGFYSSFLVADKVKVITKHINGDPNYAVIWESDSQNGYSVDIQFNDDNDFEHGTKIILNLNEENFEYLNESKLIEIIKKHSSYVHHPIYLLQKKEIPKPDVDSSNNVDSPNNVDRPDTFEDDKDDSDEEIDMDKLANDMKDGDISEDTSDDEDILNEHKLNKESTDESVKIEEVHETTDIDEIINDIDKQINDINDKPNTDDSNIDKLDDSNIDKPDETNIDKPDESNTDKLDDTTTDKLDDTTTDKLDNTTDKPDETNNDKPDESNTDKPDESNNDTNTDKQDEITYEFVEVNSKPIWCKDPKEISEDEYSEFYKSLSSNRDNYITYKHFKAEGDVEFSAILFVTDKPPFDMFDHNKINNNMKLYVKKVLITDTCKDLYPDYFNFVVGIVDSQDLQLNASRELLQQSKIIKKINKVLVKKTIEMFKELAISDSEKYDKFYNSYSKNLKLSINQDSSTKNKMLELLKFPTSKRENISFQEYIDNMKEEQSGIYYIVGNSLENIRKSVFIEKLIKNEYEVILMHDPIDEYIMQQIHDYNDKKFINVIKDDLKLNDSKEDTNKTETDEICKKIKEVLENKVTSVIVSSKIESHPVVITSPMGWSANMERIMKAQALNNNSMAPFMMEQKTLEINPNHKLIKKLVEINYDKKFIMMLYNMGLIAGGYDLADSNSFLDSLYDYV